MDVPVEQQVANAEADLLDAMVAGDVDRVAALTADDVVFNAPGGATIGKAEDLAAYRDGTLHLSQVRVLHRQVAAYEGTGQTKMLADVSVHVGDNRSELTVEWVRHWEVRDGVWLLIAATTELVRQ